MRSRRAEFSPGGTAMAKSGCPSAHSTSSGGKAFTHMCSASVRLMTFAESPPPKTVDPICSL